MMSSKIKYASLVLILCFLAFMFHNHLHFHNSQEKSNVLADSRVDKYPHFSIECNQCLNDISKIETKLKKMIFFNNPTLFPKIHVKYKAYNIVLYKLCIRPPLTLAT